MAAFLPPAPRPPSMQLDPELVAFTQQGVSMHVASCSADGVASLCRPVGIRISGDRDRVTVLLLASQAGELLADFGTNGRVALVVTLPTTHRTVQLKGDDAALEPLQDGDHALVARYREAFVAELAKMGFDSSRPQALLAGARGDLVAVAFTVRALFNQTPGPAAGARLS